MLIRVDVLQVLLKMKKAPTLVDEDKKRLGEGEGVEDDDLLLGELHGYQVLEDNFQDENHDD